MQVQGLLKAKNVFSPPFEQFCKRCSEPMLLSSAQYTSCKQETKSTFSHSLDCILYTEEGAIDCKLRMPQLQECCAPLAQTSFEDYM